MPKVRAKPMLQAIAWTLMILFLLAIPGRYVPSGSVWSYDKIGHIFLFSGLAFLWMRAFGARKAHVILLILIGGLFFAPLTEFYQGLLRSGRHADFNDAIADAIGIAIGTAAWIALTWRRRVDSNSSRVNS